MSCSAWSGHGAARSGTDPGRRRAVRSRTDGSGGSGADSGRPSGEVIEEVRRGYLWNGRVFRYAQVRVAKNVSLATLRRSVVTISASAKRR